MDLGRSLLREIERRLQTNLILSLCVLNLEGQYEPAKNGKFGEVSGIVVIGQQAGTFTDSCHLLANNNNIPALQIPAFITLRSSQTTVTDLSFPTIRSHTTFTDLLNPSKRILPAKHSSIYHSVMASPPPTQDPPQGTQQELINRLLTEEHNRVLEDPDSSHDDVMRASEHIDDEEELLLALQGSANIQPTHVRPLLPGEKLVDVCLTSIYRALLTDTG